MAKEGIGTVRMKLVSEPYYNYSTGVNPVVIVYTPDSGLNGQDYSVAWDNYMKKTFSNQPGLLSVRSGHQDKINNSRIH